MGISEHFEFEFDLPPASTTAQQPFADYLYAPEQRSTGQSNGVWGIIRSYDNPPKPGPGIQSRRPIASLRRLPPAANPRPYQPEHGQIVVQLPAPDVAFTITARRAAIV